MLMTTGVAGIDLAKFEAPIERALETYAEITEGGLELDVYSARRLEKSRGLVGYSAKSTSGAVYHGREVGKLIVVALAPGEGIGDAITYPSDATIPLAERLRKPLVLPMAKPHTASELMFNIASLGLDNPDDPFMYANHLDLLGLVSSEDGKSKRAGKAGDAGHPLPEDLAAGNGAQPRVSEIAGRREDGTRFGDPGAVFNPHADIVQVSAFLALQDHLPSGTISSIKDSLEARPVGQIPA